MAGVVAAASAAAMVAAAAVAGLLTHRVPIFRGVASGLEMLRPVTVWFGDMVVCPAGLLPPPPPGPPAVPPPALAAAIMAPHSWNSSKLRVPFLSVS